jgi:Fe-S cluster assembly protein SufD
MNNVSVPHITQSAADHFRLVSATLPGDSKVLELRTNAMERFMAKGFPLKSDEEYKYSGTEKILKDEILWTPEIAHERVIDFDSIRNLHKDALHIFLVNGELIEHASDLHAKQNKIIFCNLKIAAQNHAEVFNKYYGKNVVGFDDAFAQLNLAMACNGLLIYVPEGLLIEKPIQINHIGYANNQSFYQQHHLIIADKRASVNIIQNYISNDPSGAYYNNQVNEIFIAENAQVNYYQLQNENNQVVHINATQVLQEQNSYFDTNTITIGSAWLRNNLNIKLNGLHCETHLNGLQILSGQQHVDNHTLVDHQMPHCNSNQLYKGILKDKGTGVFNGKIFVRRDAQKTNAYQSSKNMLMSDDATMNTKPQLEIYADDVKCSHGSSTGQIDKNALFYLRSRAVSEDKARALLLHAFAIEVIQKINIPSYRSYIENIIEQRFE